MTDLETEILRNLSTRLPAALWEISDDAHTLPKARGDTPLTPTKAEVLDALDSLARGGLAILRPEGWYRVPEPEPTSLQTTLF